MVVGAKTNSAVSKSVMIRRLTLAGAAVVVVAVFGFALYVHALRGRAEFMVRTAYQLSQQDQPPTLAQLQERYGNQLKPIDGCAGSECAYTVTLSNRFLAALGIVPYTELKSYFRLRDGVVLGNLLDYATHVGQHNSVVVHVQTDFCDTCQAFDIDPWTGSSPLSTNGLVGFGNKTHASSTYTVFSLNTGCLTSGGCATVADLLPTVWRKTADNRISCQIQTDEGWVEKPANWP